MLPTLDRLYRVRKEFPFNGSALSARSLSGLENDQRSLHANRTAMLMERALRDSDSAEFYGNLRFYEELNDEMLEELLVSFRRTALRLETIRDEPQPYLPFPENATEEQKREVLAQREAALPEWQKKIEKIIDERLASYRQVLKDHPDREWRLTQVRKAATFQIANSVANQAFMVYSVYVGIETAEGQRYFQSLEEAQSVPDPVLDYLYTQVREVNEIDPLRLRGQSSTG